MSEREPVCKACDGSGLLADDENWQYSCSICGGDGIHSMDDTNDPRPILSVDENERILE